MHRASGQSECSDLVEHGVRLILGQEVKSRAATDSCRRSHFNDTGLRGMVGDLSVGRRATTEAFIERKQ